ncbi:MAG: thiamine pyrophosphate-dependent enzyme [Marinilabiliales bacterium]|nr:thiamine pyrophosphate-dependent enzyme [Marinilabiliales bacterium]
MLGADVQLSSTSDFQEAAHGRAPALATAVKRLMPDKFVFTYQGDGDLAAIGTAETIHTCNRGENILMHLHQQRHLRDDRRSDGSHNTSRE